MSEFPISTDDFDPERTAAMADTDKVLYMIVFDDADRPHEIVVGGKRARYRYKQISLSWNAHLFVKIDSNSRDERHPSASDPAAADGEPGALPTLPAPPWGDNFKAWLEARNEAEVTQALQDYTREAQRAAVEPVRRHLKSMQRIYDASPDLHAELHAERFARQLAAPPTPAARENADYQCTECSWSGSVSKAVGDQSDVICFECDASCVPRRPADSACHDATGAHLVRDEWIVTRIDPRPAKCDKKGFNNCCGEDCVHDAEVAQSRASWAAFDSVACPGGASQLQAPAAPKDVEP